MRYFVPKRRCAISDHHNSSSPSASAERSSSSPEISPDAEITVATDSSLPLRYTEIYGNESPFILGPSSRSLQHTNRLGEGCSSLRPTSPMQNGTHISLIEP